MPKKNKRPTVPSNLFTFDRYYDSLQERAWAKPKTHHHVIAPQVKRREKPAMYIFNPAIVQRIWPPPQPLSGVGLMKKEADEKSSRYKLSQRYPTFKPESVNVSIFSRNNGV